MQHIWRFLWASSYFRHIFPHYQYHPTYAMHAFSPQISLPCRQLNLGLTRTRDKENGVLYLVPPNIQGRDDLCTSCIDHAFLHSSLILKIALFLELPLASPSSSHILFWWYLGTKNCLTGNKGQRLFYLLPSQSKRTNHLKRTQL